MQLLTTAARALQRHLDKELETIGLTHAATVALQGLSEGPLHRARLAALLEVQSQSLEKSLARLESAELLTRTQDPVDHRKQILELTPAGRSRLSTAQEIIQSALPSGLFERRHLHQDLTELLHAMADKDSGW